MQEHTHWPQILKWIHEHWPEFLFVLGGIAGTMWLWLSSTFAPHTKVEKCKDQLVDRIRQHEEWEQQAHKNFEYKNSEEHDKIWGAVDSIREDVSDTKNLLIDVVARLGDKHD